MSGYSDFKKYGGPFLWVHIDYDYLDVRDLIETLIDLEMAIRLSAKDSLSERPEVGLEYGQSEREMIFAGPRYDEGLLSFEVDSNLEITIAMIETRRSVDIAVLVSLYSASILTTQFVFNTYNRFNEEQKKRRKDPNHQKSHKILLAVKTEGDDLDDSNVEYDPQP